MAPMTALLARIRRGLAAIGQMWRALNRKVHWGLVVFLCAIALVATLHQLIWTDPFIAHQGEYIDSSEHEIFRQLVSEAEQFVCKHRQDQLAKRDAHAHAHGCVAGIFKVPHLPSELRVGIFAKPAE